MKVREPLDYSIFVGFLLNICYTGLSFPKSDKTGNKEKWLNNLIFYFFLPSVAKTTSSQQLNNIDVHLIWSGFEQCF